MISGGGTTLQNLYHEIEQGKLKVKVGLVVSSSAKAKGLQFAKRRGTPVEVVPKSGDLTPQEYSEAVFSPIRNAQIDLVVMGGFLKHVLIPDDFENRVINIHPSLIPEFCGAGFYGMRVHRAVLEAGRSESGCTIHFVDNEYDHGPIIRQTKVPVLAGDTPETLQKRVFQAECESYPRVIQELADQAG